MIIINNNNNIIYPSLASLVRVSYTYWDISNNIIIYKYTQIIVSNIYPIYIQYVLHCIEYQIAEPKQSYNDIAGVKYVVWELFCIIIVIAANNTNNRNNTNYTNYNQ